MAAVSMERHFGTENQDPTPAPAGNAAYSDVDTSKAANAAAAAAAAARKLFSPSLLPLQEVPDAPIINLENWEVALEGIVRNQMSSWSNVMTRRKGTRGSRKGGKKGASGAKTAVVVAPPSLLTRRIFASSAGTLRQQEGGMMDGLLWACVGM